MAINGYNVNATPTSVVMNGVVLPPECANFLCMIGLKLSQLDPTKTFIQPEDMIASPLATYTLTTAIAAANPNATIDMNITVYRNTSDPNWQQYRYIAMWWNATAMRWSVDVFLVNTYDAELSIQRITVPMSLWQQSDAAIKVLPIGRRRALLQAEAGNQPVKNSFVVNRENVESDTGLPDWVVWVITAGILVVLFCLVYMMVSRSISKPTPELKNENVAQERQRIDGGKVRGADALFIGVKLER